MGGSKYAEPEKKLRDQRRIRTGSIKGVVTDRSRRKLGMNNRQEKESGSTKETAKLKVEDESQDVPEVAPQEDSLDVVETPQIDPLADVKVPYLTSVMNANKPEGDSLVEEKQPEEEVPYLTLVTEGKQPEGDSLVDGKQPEQEDNKTAGTVLVIIAEEEEDPRVTQTQMLPVTSTATQADQALPVLTMGEGDSADTGFLSPNEDSGDPGSIPIDLVDLFEEPSEPAPLLRQAKLQKKRKINPNPHQNLLLHQAKLQKKRTISPYRFLSNTARMNHRLYLLSLQPRLQKKRTILPYRFLSNTATMNHHLYLLSLQPRLQQKRMIRSYRFLPNTATMNQGLYLHQNLNQVFHIIQLILLLVSRNQSLHLDQLCILRLHRRLSPLQLPKLLQSHRHSDPQRWHPRMGQRLYPPQPSKQHLRRQRLTDRARRMEKGTLDFPRLRYRKRLPIDIK